MKKRLPILAACIWCLAFTGAAAKTGKSARAPGFAIVSQNIQKTFTPGVDPFPKAVYTVNNPEGDKVTGKIYNMRGELVADMRVVGNYADPVVTLEWDGSGARKGVYIYHIEAGGKVISGTVIAAR
jgi:hypothetical protein